MMTNGSVISFCPSQWRASSWIPVKLIPTSSCRTTIPPWLRRDMKTGLCWAKSDSHGWVDHLAQCFSSSEKIWVCQHSNDGLKYWFGVCRYDLTWRSLCHLLAVPRTMRCSLNQRCTIVLKDGQIWLCECAPGQQSHQSLLQVSF